jgi:hypothetical protein
MRFVGVLTLCVGCTAPRFDRTSPPRVAAAEDRVADERDDGNLPPFERFARLLERGGILYQLGFHPDSEQLVCLSWSVVPRADHPGEGEFRRTASVGDVRETTVCDYQWRRDPPAHATVPGDVPLTPSGTLTMFGQSTQREAPDGVSSGGFGTVAAMPVLALDRDIVSAGYLTSAACDRARADALSRGGEVDAQGPGLTGC